MSFHHISGIYFIKNVKNKKMYIGLAVNVGVRFNGHRRDLRNNNHYNDYLQNAWNKYGEENFEFGILEKCEKNFLNEKERYYIKKYNTNNKKFGYNLTSGGECGKELDKSTKRKMSKRMIGNNYSKGNVLSDKVKKQISKSLIGNQYRTGIKHRPEDKEKITRSCQGKKYGKTSKYIGVSYYKKYKKWKTAIKKNRKYYFIGFFKNEIDAAKAYDKKAIELYGLTAKVNFKKGNI